MTKSILANAVKRSEVKLGCASEIKINKLPLSYRLANFTAVAVKLGCASEIKINKLPLSYRLANFTAVAVKLGCASEIKINKLFCISLGLR